MARRPIEQKKRRRIAKSLRRTSLPAKFDLIQWLLDHGHASSKREAREIILAHRVTSNSHPLGLGKKAVIEDGKIDWADTVDPFVSTDHRSDIVVAAA